MTATSKGLAGKLERKRRRREGLCTVCGKPVDRDGALCISCAEKKRIEAQKRKEMFMSAFICPVCGINIIFPGEQSCPECKAKFAVTNANRKEYLHHKFAERRERLKNEGLCIACGKEKVTEGHVYCDTCLEKAKERRKENRKHKPKNHKQSDWISDMKCAVCGADNLVPGKKVCPRCYEIKMKSIAKCHAKRDERYGKFWRETNAEMISTRTKFKYPLPRE